jgi:hypothetical protein
VSATARRPHLVARTTALLVRELRSQSRGWVRPVLRGALALLLLLILLPFTEEFDRGGGGGVGKLFFAWTLIVSTVAVGIVGMSLFASVVAEEKEEGTIGLLRLAGVSAPGLVLGKGLSVLLQLLLLLAAMLPFLALSITLGGVAQTQVWAGVTLLVALLVQVAGLGLLASVLMPTVQRAMNLAMVLLFVRELLPFLAWGVAALATEGSPPAWWESIASTTTGMRFGEVFGFAAAPEPIAAHTWISLGCGVLGIVLALLLFRRRVDDAESSEPRAVGVGRRRFFSPNQAPTGLRALVWKERWFVLGGRLGLGVRWVMAVLIATLLYWLATTYNHGGGLMTETDWERLGWMWLHFGWIIGVLDTGARLAQVFRTDVRAQTLSSLALTPCSIGRICWAKVRALVPGGLPWVLITGAGLVLCLDEIGRALNHDEAYPILACLAMTVGVFLALSAWGPLVHHRLGMISAILGLTVFWVLTGVMTALMNPGSVHIMWLPAFVLGALMLVLLADIPRRMRHAAAR